MQFQFSLDVVGLFVAVVGMAGWALKQAFVIHDTVTTVTHLRAEVDNLERDLRVEIEKKIEGELKHVYTAIDDIKKTLDRVERKIDRRWTDDPQR